MFASKEKYVRKDAVSELAARIAERPEIVSGIDKRDAREHFLDHIYAISQTVRRAPLSIPFSGNFQFYSGKTAGVASGGYFWSSTSYSTTNARGLNFDSYNLTPQNTNYKGTGFPVRCAAEKIIVLYYF